MNGSENSGALGRWPGAVAADVEVLRQRAIARELEAAGLALEDAPPAATLNRLEAWRSARPGRSYTIRHWAGDGWHVNLFSHPAGLDLALPTRPGLLEAVEIALETWAAACPKEPT